MLPALAAEIVRAPGGLLSTFKVMVTKLAVQELLRCIAKSAGEMGDTAQDCTGGTRDGAGDTKDGYSGDDTDVGRIRCRNACAGTWSASPAPSALSCTSF